MQSVQFPPIPAATLAASLALLAGAASAQVFTGVGELADCKTYGICPDALAETCEAASQTQRVFVAVVSAEGETDRNKRWVETEYSRFPGSSVNEETGFLPVTMLGRETWQARIADLAAGREVMSGPANAVWARRNDDGKDASFDLYQFNPRGLAKRWKVSCRPGGF